jgi:phosphoglucomutase
MVPRCLKEMGFSNIHSVAEQAVPDGNFPTVVSPNPEEAAALKLALEQAEALGADLVMGTDPDADRVGIAVRNLEGKLELLNGNQTGALLTHYLVTRWSELGRLNGYQYVVKTIVTSNLLYNIADAKHVDCHQVLTGFKYIAEFIQEMGEDYQFIFGGEESYGYLAGDLVRDKDAVQSCMLVAEMCAWAKNKGKSLYEVLIDIYVEHDLYVEELVSITKKGKAGVEEINQMMDNFRNNPPQQVGGAKLMAIMDYKLGVLIDLCDEEPSELAYPKSDVMQFEFADGSIVTARPSGTEPKIKFYFSVYAPLKDRSEYESLRESLKQRISTIKSDLGLL